ncbi:polysaccharide deacetylase family protein [Aminipila sp.]|uniref:polysaccharide deacetylase family protein n=1 Tax=Aminipila sp. TaxID=2060095 RepID=UPI00289654BB|nr:polysaccharide deacetylase family protein [Aminipila sp.]
MLIKSLCLIGICTVLSYSIFPTCWYKIKQRRNRSGRKDSKVYLTFDDGPHRQFTEKLLDLLKKYNIKASFFVVGKFAESNPDMIKRMKEEGHLIGLHSLEHKNALWQTVGYTNKDFKESEAVFNRLGMDIQFFRPPWGHFNLDTVYCAKRMGFKIAMWNVMAEDWKGNTTWQEIAAKLIRRTRAGDIICLHDGRGTNNAPERTIRALEEVLPVWISQGYQFARMDERYESDN